MTNSSVVLSIIGFFGGFFLLFKSAGYFVDAAVKISNHFNISRLTTGIVIAGVATTAPESTVSVISSIRGYPQIAFGNAYGSIICNTGFALGLAYIIAHRRICLKRGDITTMLYPLVIVLVFSVYFASNLTISRLEGVILLFLLAGYMLYNSKKGSNTNGDIPKQKGIVKPMIGLFVSLICIVAFSRIVVESAVFLASFVGISDTVIGLSIIALGTSLPEVSASVSAAVKNEPEIAVGNIVGANILNLLLVVGLASIAKPIAISLQDFKTAVPVSVAFMVVLFIFLFVGKNFGRLKGLVLLVAYALYNFLLFF